MKLIQVLVSVTLLSFVPSFGVYAILQYYFNLDPLYINLINGLLMFILGGTLIAMNYPKSDQKENMDGSS